MSAPLKPEPLPPLSGRSLRPAARAALGLGATLLLYFVFAPYVGKSQPATYEGWALANLKSVLRAQQAYRAANGGFYDSLECVVDPARCIPGHRAERPLLDRSFLDPQGRGYMRYFHPGPPAPPEAIDRAGASQSSLTSFAYVAIPLEPGLDGRRAFCIDDTGTIRFTFDGVPPVVEAGRCGTSGNVLE